MAWRVTPSARATSGVVNAFGARPKIGRTEMVGFASDSPVLAMPASAVAREYGLPAVVGTGDATKRISTGQRVRVDGDRGIVQVIG